LNGSCSPDGRAAVLLRQRPPSLSLRDIVDRLFSWTMFLLTDFPRRLHAGTPLVALAGCAGGSCGLAGGVPGGVVRVCRSPIAGRLQELFVERARGDRRPPVRIRYESESDARRAAAGRLWVLAGKAGGPEERWRGDGDPGYGPASRRPGPGGAVRGRPGAGRGDWSRERWTISRATTTTPGWAQART